MAKQSKENSESSRNLTVHTSDEVRGPKRLTANRPDLIGVQLTAPRRLVAGETVEVSATQDDQYYNVGLTRPVRIGQSTVRPGDALTITGAFLKALDGESENSGAFVNVVASSEAP